MDEILYFNSPQFEKIDENDRGISYIETRNDPGGIRLNKYKGRLTSDTKLYWDANGDERYYNTTLPKNSCIDIITDERDSPIRINITASMKRTPGRNSMIRSQVNSCPPLPRASAPPMELPAALPSAPPAWMFLATNRNEDPTANIARSNSHSNTTEDPIANENPTVNVARNNTRVNNSAENPTLSNNTRKNEPVSEDPTATGGRRRTAHHKRRHTRRHKRCHTRRHKRRHTRRQ
jgi:hypothetical protein